MAVANMLRDESYKYMTINYDESTVTSCIVVCSVLWTAFPPVRRGELRLIVHPGDHIVAVG